MHMDFLPLVLLIALSFEYGRQAHARKLWNSRFPVKPSATAQSAILSLVHEAPRTQSIESILRVVDICGTNAAPSESASDTYLLIMRNM